MLFNQFGGYTEEPFLGFVAIGHPAVAESGGGTRHFSEGGGNHAAGAAFGGGDGETGGFQVLYGCEGQ